MKTLIPAIASFLLVACGSGAPAPTTNHVPTADVTPPAPTQNVETSVNGYSFWARTAPSNGSRELSVRFIPEVPTQYPVVADLLGGTASYSGPYSGAYTLEGQRGYFLNGEATATANFNEAPAPQVSVTLDTNVAGLPVIGTEVPALTNREGQFEFAVIDGNMTGTIRGGFTDRAGSEIVGAIVVDGFNNNPDNSIAGAFAVTKD